MDPFVSIAPGRLCLFGEHQDYLGLPVIALALPLTCRIQVTPSDSHLLTLQLPSWDETRTYDLEQLKSPQEQQVESKTTTPDFALAVVKEALKDGWKIQGATCISSTNIPIAAGCSSSSAFCVAWVQVIARLAGKVLSPLKLAMRAHQAEVLHFGAPGGTMDHMTSALGGSVLRIGPGLWEVDVLPWSMSLGVWVLADSGQAKDTLRHLNRCKTARLDLFHHKLGENWDAIIEEEALSKDEHELLQATLTNRNMEQSAAEILRGCTEDRDEQLGEKLGALMLQHHHALRDGLGLSTPRLEALQEAALQAGAWGFKVVGSGGGGCGVAWTSEERARVVATAMEQAGAPSTWIIREPAPGASIVDGLES